MQDQSHETAAPAATPKEEWVKPEISSVQPITDARGNGGAGFDFASEVS